MIGGGLLLWVGWFFFNAASGYEIVDVTETAIPQLIVINTILAPSSAALTFIIYEYCDFSACSKMSPQDPSRIMNAILAGLVSITAPCNNVEPWAACIIGIIGSFVYIVSAKLMIKFKIDDPIEASQIHGFTGLWGCISVGFFDKDLGLVYIGSLEQLKI